MTSNEVMVLRHEVPRCTVVAAEVERVEVNLQWGIQAQRAIPDAKKVWPDSVVLTLNDCHFRP